MKSIVIADAAFGTSFAIGNAVLRQCTDPIRTACAAVRRTVSDRKEALEDRLQEFVLELLAAIVLVAIFMIMTEPATQTDAGGHPSPNPTGD
jgi:hypothetical protein